MESEKMITVVDVNGSMRDVELLLAFEMDGKKYAVYTYNDKDHDGRAIIYVGKLIFRDGRQFLVNVDDGGEWERIKNIMRKMVKMSLEVVSGD